MVFCHLSVVCVVCFGELGGRHIQYSLFIHFQVVITYGIPVALWGCSFRHRSTAFLIRKESFQVWLLVLISVSCVIELLQHILSNRMIPATAKERTFELTPIVLK